ncbi:serine O-acetyltransferase EpsC [Cyanobium sp. Morenito 9A2]|uniref:serine O-acetyltransferase EpsC n=1 Tax=Cyanobium sp. Morenito 9A2 TaxID=2823718 RepID=UPI0020CE848E|nr:serine O-acetyltransferase EpsC [Cyanobium sp. Morenito 9A2]MCP9848488.1 serine acetyltransferase [Cyanobium sp. Morenito 9A2]
MVPQELPFPIRIVEQPEGSRAGAGGSPCTWDLGGIVEALSQPTSHTGLDWARHHPFPLPSPELLQRVFTGLRSVLFPHHFGDPDRSGAGLTYFIGHTLDQTLQLLAEQVKRELWLSGSALHLDLNALQLQAIELTGQFAAQLPGIRRLLEGDLLAAHLGDPAAKNLDEVLFCYPGIRAITTHRIAHELYRLGLPLIARIISELGHSETGVDIHPGASIGAEFFIDHGTGVVIGETCIIGERVRLYQAVTLGARSFPRDESGALIKGQPRHPIVEDDVVIYAGATVLGRITIGAHSTIGGNVWVTQSVPAGSFVSQAKARQDTFDGGAGI